MMAIVSKVLIGVRTLLGMKKKQNQWKKNQGIDFETGQVQHKGRLFKNKEC